MLKFKPLPSFERLNELFEYDSESGILTRKELGDGSCLKLPVGKLTSYGYLTVYIKPRNYFIHRIAWKMVYGSDPVGCIDHIDCNKTNNSIANLRCATISQNAANRKIQKNNTSGFKGVSYCKRREMWYAHISKKCKTICLGIFKTPEEAAQAYAKAAKRKFGEFARW